jgi:hypothetical protein
MDACRWTSSRRDGPLAGSGASRTTKAACRTRRRARRVRTVGRRGRRVALVRGGAAIDAAASSTIRKETVMRCHPILPLFGLLLGVLPPAARADAVTDWNASAGAAAQAACISPANDPLHEARLYAMLHLAVHDALNAIERRFRPYAYDAVAPAGTSLPAAVAAAARDVLVSQLALTGAPFPPECAAAGVASAEAAYTQALAAIPDGPGKAQGLALGQAAAAAVIARRSGDGSDTPLVDPNYPQGTLPGQWRFTPGSPPIAFAVGWGQVRPFVLKDAAQFRPGPPLPVGCDADPAGCRQYADDVEEVRALGSDGLTAPSARTPEQTQIALFWIESSPLAWNRIARTVSASRGLDPWRNARLFGLLNIALADGYVASWSTKYHYRFWRPATAIRLAADDGNPHTNADANWNSLVPTPPIPDYESGHAVQGAAAAQVMKRVFGRDSFGFAACSLTLPEGSRCGDAQPVLRHYHGFWHAARENGVSRIYVGFHFRDAVDKGLVHGRKIADWAVGRALQPLGQR